MNNYSIRDKSDQGVGLSLTKAVDNSVTTYVYQVNIDSRDCIGDITLKNAQLAYELAGGKGFVSGYITNVTGNNVEPIEVTLAPLSTVLKLQIDDKIIIKNVLGNTNANGEQTIGSISYEEGKITLKFTKGNGDYQGQGFFTRPADAGYPRLTEISSIIRENTMIIYMNDILKNIREIIVDYATIPRDIIPIETYIVDLIDESTNLESEEFESTANIWSTFIPQEANLIEQRSIGFYSTPIDIFRSYQGSFSLQDSVSPCPLRLWSPPIGPWPLQPQPYPFQTVPTYQSNEFIVPGYTETFHLVLSGYGLYDLKDWTSNTGVPITDAAITSIVRKLLLLNITGIQSYNDVDYINMILSCNTVDPNNFVSPFGYGDFQRFIPGPGIQLNYQPGTSDNANPSIARVDSPVPFPYFYGNVWGPYDSPDARFQKLGLRSTLQDLFLNGDTNNLLGNPIIKPNVPTSNLMNDSTFGISFSGLQTVDLNNLAAASNLNILNAMRIIPNGFGAKTVRSNGQGNSKYPNEYYTNGYQNAGGQGPSLNTNSTWSSTGVYGNFVGTLNDPIAGGPSSSDVTINSANPFTEITSRTSFNDLGPNGGQFITQLNNYVAFTINDLPDSDIIMYIDEALKNERSLSTNSENVNANLIIPMRLNLGTVSGTIQYMESVYSLLAGSTYWNKRFLTPKSSLNKLHISFRTFEGQPINLEKMLQPRKSTQFLQLFSNIITQNIDIVPELTNFDFFFVYDPFNPKYVNHMKRYIQLLLKIECYEYTQIGLIPDAIGERRNTLLNTYDQNDNPNETSGDFTTVEPYNNYQ